MKRLYTSVLGVVLLISTMTSFAAGCVDEAGNACSAGRTSWREVTGSGSNNTKPKDCSSVKVCGDRCQCEYGGCVTVCDEGDAKCAKKCDSSLGKCSGDC